MPGNWSTPRWQVSVIFFLFFMRRLLYCFLLSETRFKRNFPGIQFFTFKVNFSKFYIVPFFSNDFIAPSEGLEMLKFFLFLKNSFLSQNFISVIWKGRYLALIMLFSLYIFSNNITKELNNEKTNKTKIIIA